MNSHGPAWASITREGQNMNCGLGNLGASSDTLQQLAKSLAFALDMASQADHDCEQYYQQAMQAGEDKSAGDRACQRMKLAERTRELGDEMAAHVEAQAEAAGIDVLDVIALAEEYAVRQEVGDALAPLVASHVA